MHEKEIAALDQIYMDMVEAIHHKPQSTDIEEIRLYLDNLYAILNRTALTVNEVKNLLQKGEPFKHETNNPPA